MIEHVRPLLLVEQVAGYPIGWVGLGDGLVPGAGTSMSGWIGGCS
jgi:hypothetical protein